jgi:phosphatidylserine synthase
MAKPRKRRDGDQIALAALITVLGSLVGFIGLIAAAKKYIHHPTYGNAARMFLATLHLAEDVE